MNPALRRFLLDIGPLLIFWAAFKLAGIYWATGALMAAVLASLAFSYITERRIALMPLVTAVMVVILGGLTLYLQDKTFLKMKPTAVYIFFGSVLIAGLAFKRLFIKDVMSLALDVDDDAWRVLTWRWSIFFFALAGLNEFVWRNFSDDAWVTFKVWGIVPLFFLFSLAQTPYLMAHEKKDAPPPG